MRVPTGIKLVRGARMSTERQVSDSLGVQSPIQNIIEETPNVYNRCGAFMLEEVAKRPAGSFLQQIILNQLVGAKAIDLWIGKQSGELQFAQLYGMADSLTFGLRNAVLIVRLNNSYDVLPICNGDDRTDEDALR